LIHITAAYHCLGVSVIGTEIMCKPTLLVLKFTWLLMTCKWTAAIHPSLKIHSFMSDILLRAFNRNLLWVTILMLMFPLVLFLYHEMYCCINEGLLLRLVSMLLMSYSIYSTLQIFLYVPFLTHSTSTFPVSRSCMGYSSSHSFTVLLF
jgi:hypothetical protein